jgi:hypothetical protein
MVGGIEGPVGGLGGAQARPTEAKLSKHEKVDRGDIVDQNRCCSRNLHQYVQERGKQQPAFLYFLLEAVSGSS